MKFEILLDLIHDGPTAFTLTGNRRPLLRYENSGKAARLLDLEPPFYDWRNVLRWGTPYALAPQGHVVVHGSAVRSDREAVAFLGFGGAGKSTLARALRKRGWEFVADDMMVCDPEGRVNRLGEQVMYEWRESHARVMTPHLAVDYSALATHLADPVNQDWVALDGLFFLDERRPGSREFAFRRVAASETFRRLEQHGFAGSPSPRAWEHQFHVYGSLARGVPCGVLEVPDGLRHMLNALPRFQESLSQWLGSPRVATC